MIKTLKFLLKSKNAHFLSVTKEQWEKYHILIRIAVYFNPHYIGCNIRRKKYKLLKNIVIVGLRWYGKNVQRRTTGYAKEFLKTHKNAKCLYCNKRVTSKNGTTDHIIPISKGGNNCQVNLIVCCFDCNNERGDMHFEDYLRLKNPFYSGKRKIPFI